MKQFISSIGMTSSHMHTMPSARSSVYKALEGKETVPGEVQERSASVEAVRKARNSYLVLFG